MEAAACVRKEELDDDYYLSSAMFDYVSPLSGFWIIMHEIKL